LLLGGGPFIAEDWLDLVAPSGDVLSDSESSEFVDGE